MQIDKLFLTLPSKLFISQACAISQLWLFKLNLPQVILIKNHLHAETYLCSGEIILWFFSLTVRLGKEQRKTGSECVPRKLFTVIIYSHIESAKLIHLLITLEGPRPSSYCLFFLHTGHIVLGPESAGVAVICPLVLLQIMDHAEFDTFNAGILSALADISFCVPY